MAEVKKDAKETKKPTEYVVLQSESPTGPFNVVGNFSAYGQIAAKKAAAASLYGEHNGADPEQSYFTAVPASSWVPQKPVIQMTISFLTDAGEEQPEEDEDAEDDEDDASVDNELVAALDEIASSSDDEFAASLDDE